MAVQSPSFAQNVREWVPLEPGSLWITEATVCLRVISGGII